MDAIILSDTPQFYVVVGGYPTASRLLVLAAQLALRGPLLLLDCGNHANPIPVARTLRRLTPDPVQALGNIHIARAFTCYQVVTLLTQMIALPNQQPLLIFDLLSTYYDENVSCAEAQRLLQQSLYCITQLRRTAPVMVSVKPPPASFAERSAFVEMVCNLSDRFWIEEPSLVYQPQQLSLFS